jgi:ribulose-5-phosphate 4-epimerase/fuculose-1-phosphate aldolase
VVASGPIKPSSGALTHGALYAADPQLRAVLHVHSPEIWQAAMALGMPVTDHRIAYGTPAMAAEMQRLYHEPHVRDGGMIVMGGHAEGVVSFGAGLSLAGGVLVRTLARALEVVG